MGRKSDKVKTRLGEEQIVRRVDIFTVAFVAFFAVLAIGYLLTAYFPNVKKAFSARPAVADEKKPSACCPDKKKQQKKSQKMSESALPKSGEYDD